MANIRVRKETGKLYLDFFIKGMRFREQTMLEDTPNNHKTLERLMQTIEAKIVLNKFFNKKNFLKRINVIKEVKIGRAGKKVELRYFNRKKSYLTHRHSKSSSSNGI